MPRTASLEGRENQFSSPYLSPCRLDGIRNADSNQFLSGMMANLVALPLALSDDRQHRFEKATFKQIDSERLTRFDLANTVRNFLRHLEYPGIVRMAAARILAFDMSPASTASRRCRNTAFASWLTGSPCGIVIPFRCRMAIKAGWSGLA